MTKKYGQILLCIIAGAVLSFMALIPVRPAVAQDYPETTPTGTPVIPPQFYLTPWEGNRGSWISIKGSTFTNSSIIKFYFSSDTGGTSSSIDSQIKAYKYLGSVYTTGAGFIDNSVAPGNQALYQVPYQLNNGVDKENTPDGACYIYATYSTSKNVIALATFTVTTPATISITPNNGLVGDNIGIAGKEFAANEKVTAKYDDRDVAIKGGNPKTTANGEFQGTIQIPDSADGKHTISITDETGNSPKGNFTVSSSIALSPATQAVGGKVIVNGTGFGARKPVSISINGREITSEEAPLSTTQYGSFQATVTVPFDFAYLNGGKAIIAANGMTSAASAELSISATTPVITFSPEVSSAKPAYAGMTLTVNGMWFKPGDKINIFIDGSQVPVANITVNDNNSFSVAFVLPPGKSGVHNLTAAGSKGSATTTYIMESEAPPAPVQKSPRITGTSGEAPRLSWYAVTDPSGVTYNLEVAADRDFNNMLVEKQGLSGTEYTFTAAESARLKSGASCYWRVRAMDGAQNASEWTPASLFFVEFPWLSIPAWAIYMLVGLGILILLIAYLYIRKRTTFKKNYGAI